MDQEQIDQGREEAAHVSAEALVRSFKERWSFQPRAVVRWFAQQMEHKLHVYDDKQGWWREDMTQRDVYLNAIGGLKFLDDERKELSQAIESWRAWQRDENGDENDPSFLQAVIDEAADVANFAMMIADLISRKTPFGVQGNIDGRGVSIDNFPKRRHIFALHPDWMEMLGRDLQIVMDLEVEQFRRNDEKQWVYKPYQRLYTLGDDAFEREIDAISYAQKQLLQLDASLLRHQAMLNNRTGALIVSRQ